MKHFRFCLLLFLPLALACSQKAYDISEGFNPELTLFEDQISVPVGSIGPLTLNLVFNKLGQTPGIGTLLADYIKIGDDGYLNMEDSGTILSANVYELERMMPDPGVASSCNAGSRSGFIGGLVGLLDFINDSPYATIFRAEIVAPLGYTVGFIYGIERDFDFF